MSTSPRARNGDYRGMFENVRNSILTLPIATKWLIYSIWMCSVVVMVVGDDVQYAVCTLPYSVLTNWLMAYRWLLSPFFHVNVIHLIFNTIALVHLAQVEVVVGTMYYLHLSFVLMVVISVMNFTISVILGVFISSFSSLLRTCAVGYSGILFAMMVIFVNMSHYHEQRVHLMGIISVKSQWYPVALLIALQVVTMNRVDLLVHVCGIVAGYLHVKGLLSPFMFIQSVYQSAEHSRTFSMITKASGFVPLADTPRIVV